MEDYFAKIDSLVEATKDTSANASANASGESCRDYMDEQSLIDYYWMQEFSKNGDAYSGSSTYLYKKRNGKLYWGPTWDFDWVAWGARSTDYRIDETGADALELLSAAPWVETLPVSDLEFRENVKKRWKVFSEKLTAAASDGGMLDSFKNKYYYQALANYQVR